MIVGAIYGAITGATAGVIISGFNLNIFIGMAFGLFFNLFLGIALIFVAGGGGWSNGMTKVYFATIIVGIINGAIVSLVNSSGQSLK